MNSASGARSPRFRRCESCGESAEQHVPKAFFRARPFSPRLPTRGTIARTSRLSMHRFPRLAPRRSRFRASRKAVSAPFAVSPRPEPLRSLAFFQGSIRAASGRSRDRKPSPWRWTASGSPLHEALLHPFGKTPPSAFPRHRYAGASLLSPPRTPLSRGPGISSGVSYSVTAPPRRPGQAALPQAFFPHCRG